MRGRVDAACQPAHDRDTVRGEVGAQVFGDRQRIR
jgi:hypothetical protein